MIEVLVAGERIFAIVVLVLSLLILASGYRRRARNPELFATLALKSVIVIAAAALMLTGSLILHPW